MRLLLFFLLALIAGILDQVSPLALYLSSLSFCTFWFHHGGEVLGALGAQIRSPLPFPTQKCYSALNLPFRCFDVTRLFPKHQMNVFINCISYIFTPLVWHHKHGPFLTTLPISVNGKHANVKMRYHSLTSAIIVILGISLTLTVAESNDLWNPCAMYFI